MRSLIEIVIVGALVALAWDKSISERIGEVVPALTAKQSSRVAMRATPVAGASPSGAWMWDPNRRTALDRPAYDSRQRNDVTADEQGRRYWLDAQGRRQYER